MKIFSNKNLKFQKIGNDKLFLQMVLPYTFITIVILSLWTAFDMFTSVVLTDFDRSYLEVHERELTCASETFYGLLAFLIWFLLLLLFGCVVAYKTKNVYKIFKEAESTAFITYNTLLCLIIMVILKIVLEGNVRVIITDTIMMVSLWVMLTGCSIILFAPKVYRLHIKQKSTYDTTPTTGISSDGGKDIPMNASASRRKSRPQIQTK